MTIDLSVLEVGAQLVTFDGHRARLLANDVDSHLACVVAVRWNEMEHAYTCSAGGAIFEPCPVDRRNGFRIVGLAPRTVRVRVRVHHYAASGEWGSSSYAEREPGFGDDMSDSDDGLLADEIVEITLKADATAP